MIVTLIAGLNLDSANDDWLDQEPLAKDYS
jgi:hypothetical protein